MTIITRLDKDPYSSNTLLRSMASVHQMMGVLKDHIRQLYFRAVLLAKACPECSQPDLVMIRDSWCRCRSCNHEMDPTEVFQMCPACRSGLTRKVYHYWCDHCRAPVRSLYSFDAKVFDPIYFREMMRTSRERKRERRETVRQLLDGSRSAPLQFSESPIIETLPGLDQALNRFVNMPLPISLFLFADGRPRFDMHLYRQHIRDLAAGCVVHFEGISKLIPDARLDRIFRFITIIFMQQDGEIEIRQDFTGKITVVGK